MTLNQLQSLTEDELALVLYVVNVIAPPASPKMEFEPKHLVWFRHDALIKKLLDSFNNLKPEGHATYTSLMEKLGVKIEIKPVPLPETPPPPPPTSSETSSLNPSSSVEVTVPLLDIPKTGSSEITSSL